MAILRVACMEEQILEKLGKQKPDEGPHCAENRSQTMGIPNWAYEEKMHWQRLPYMKRACEKHVCPVM